jgi:hypothetical protein
MPGKSGFDFSGASQSFNALAEYLFGKVVRHFRTESHSCILKFYRVAFGRCISWFPLSILGQVIDVCCCFLC